MSRRTRCWSRYPATTQPGTQALRIDHDSVVYGVAFAPDGHLLATTTAAGTCQLWQLPEETG